jgi:nucleotide-binding universal stress UspA family protein
MLIDDLADEAAACETGPALEDRRLIKPFGREKILSTSQYRAGAAPAKSALTFRNVLFATDFSGACDNAWWYALALARHYHSKLFIAHVISPAVYALVPPELLGEARNRTRLETQAQMARIQRRRGGIAGLESEALLREGDIASSLLRLVSEYNIDLLVAATRGHRHLKRLLLGSVAEKLFRQASCPVLVVPEQARMSAAQALGIHRIVCPIDFSPASSAALMFAIQLALEYEAELILAHVAAGPALNSVQQMNRFMEPIKDRLRGLLSDPHGLASEPRYEVRFGAAAEGIFRIAVEYQSDLTVVAVHSAGPAQAHEYERTAYRVIRLSQCPVFAIPSPSQKGSNAVKKGEA